ncbi:MAG: hypothetical protein JO317_05555 [Verrucomicrobiae bacterium]|nr:hypothetical protein [Verrucomicrobiae bacterium]
MGFDAVDSFLVQSGALRFIAATLGVVTLIVTAWGLGAPDSFRRFLVDLPRNRTWASGLLVINVAWSAPLTANFLRSMEVNPQWIGLVYWVLAPLAFVYILAFVHNFLGARMLAWFLLLCAKPILLACLVRDTPAKFVLVVLAYYWIFAAMFIVAAPHLFRDLLLLFAERPPLLRKAMLVKGAFGVALIALAIVAY